MKGLTLIFLLCAALLLVACGSSSNNTASTDGNTSTGTNTATKPETKPTTTTTGSTTGVASCDEYLSKIEKCLNSPNVPEAGRAAFKQGYDQIKNSAASTTPEGRAALETSCKRALEAAKASLDMCK